jgi:hypothetical protein
MDSPKNHKKHFNKNCFSLLMKLFEPVFEGCFFFVALILVAIGLIKIFIKVNK